MWCGLFGPQANEDRRALTLLTEAGNMAGSQLIQRSGRTVDNLMFHSLRAMVAMCHGLVFDRKNSIAPESYLFQWVSNVLAQDDDRCVRCAVRPFLHTWRCNGIVCCFPQDPGPGRARRRAAAAVQRPRERRAGVCLMAVRPRG
jgi:hypothetical protein